MMCMFVIKHSIIHSIISIIKETSAERFCRGATSSSLLFPCVNNALCIHASCSILAAHLFPNEGRAASCGCCDVQRMRSLERWLLPRPPQEVKLQWEWQACHSPVCDNLVDLV